MYGWVGAYGSPCIFLDAMVIRLSFGKDTAYKASLSVPMRISSQAGLCLGVSQAGPGRKKSRCAHYTPALPFPSQHCPTAADTPTPHLCRPCGVLTLSSCIMCCCSSVPTTQLCCFWFDSSMHGSL